MLELKVTQGDGKPLLSFEKNTFFNYILYRNKEISSKLVFYNSMK